MHGESGERTFLTSGSSRVKLLDLQQLGRLAKRCVTAKRPASCAWNIDHTRQGKGVVTLECENSPDRYTAVTVLRGEDTTSERCTRKGGSAISETNE